MGLWLIVLIGIQPQVQPQARVTCVKHRKEVRYRNYGYDHLVHLTNRCAQRATCRVSTNVNPKPIRVTLASGASTTVLTFRGSPARVFKAHVRCRLR